MPYFAGYHQWTLPAVPGGPPPQQYGSFEVFYVDKPFAGADCPAVKAKAKGWYWWACFPGCLPDDDGDPCGPFPTAEGAYLDAIGE